MTSISKSAQETDTRFSDSTKLVTKKESFPTDVITQRYYRLKKQIQSHKFWFECKIVAGTHSSCG